MCFTRNFLYPTIQRQVLATVVALSAFRNYTFIFLYSRQYLYSLALYLYSPLCALLLAHTAIRKTTENLGRSTTGYRPNRRKNFRRLGDSNPRLSGSYI